MFNTLFEFFLCMADVLCLHFFISLFLPIRQCLSPFIKGASLLLFGLSIHYLTLLESYSSLSTLLIAFNIIIYSIFIFNGKIKNKILLGSIFYIFLGVLSALVFTLSSTLLRTDLSILMAYNSPTRFIVCLIIKLLTLVSIVCMGYFKKDMSTELPTNYWWCFLGLFCLSFGGILIIFELALLSSNTLFNKLLIGLSFILLFFNVIIYSLFQKIALFFIEKRKLDHFSTQQHLLEEHILEVEKNQQEIRKIRHDMLNHYTVIDHLLHSSKLSECQQYISELKAQLNQVPIYYKTGNDIADILINQKIYSLQHESIDFNIQAHIPSSSSLMATDLCIILSNLLDNAIEAVLEVPPSERRISLIIRPHESKLLLDFSNTVHETPLKNGTLQRRPKKNPHEHGFGLSNVHYVVKKYNGYMQYTCEENIFNISLLIDYL